MNDSIQFIDEDKLQQLKIGFYNSVPYDIWFILLFTDQNEHQSSDSERV